MKIGIPVNDNSMESSVCLSLGRAPYFLIYDIGSKKSSFLGNDAVASQGGAGVEAAQIIVDSGVDALITPRCGKNAAEVLNAGDIKLYKIINSSIEDNIDAFIQKKLDILDEIHDGFHGHRGK